MVNGEIIRVSLHGVAGCIHAIIEQAEQPHGKLLPQLILQAHDMLAVAGCFLPAYQGGITHAQFLDDLGA